jgi:pyruvate dehydrogenase E2 component (dihydrolipoamide acetyltransferase)
MSATREIRLPALSATMESATLLTWKVSVGDEVKEGQPIAEVATDKVDMDLESPFDGVIESLAVSPGDSVALGAVVAVARTESEDLLGGLDFAPDAAGEPERSETASAPAPEPAKTNGGGSIVPASPPARKMARERGVDLTDVTPTGARGQITPSDVKKYVEAQQDHAPATEETSSSAPPSAAGAPLTPIPPAAAEPVAPNVPATGDTEAAKRLSIRRATAEVMNRTAAIPQFTLYRTLILDRAQAKRNGRSWTTELVRALASALREHPEMNARWDPEAQNTVPFGSTAIGLAVDRPGIGLVVAAVADPDVGDPADADQAVRMAADRAKTGKLRPEDMVQASVTLSNLGGLGVERFNALLFPPQAAILSAGAIKMRPVATGDGALKAALTCEVGLTVDHRVADGADGARYLETFARIVEGR